MALWLRRFLGSARARLFSNIGDPCLLLRLLALFNSNHRQLRLILLRFGFLLPQRGGPTFAVLLVTAVQHSLIMKDLLLLEDFLESDAVRVFKDGRRPQLWPFHNLKSRLVTLTAFNFYLLPDLQLRAVTRIAVCAFGLGLTYLLPLRKLGALHTLQQIQFVGSAQLATILDRSQLVFRSFPHEGVSCSCRLNLEQIAALGGEGGFSV